MFVRVPTSECWGGDEKLGFKECIVVVLELAETILHAENLVVCLEKSRADLAHLMRAFMFVGFEMVHPAVYGFGDGYVLLGCSV
ncbi:ornithine decarboxylase antizyme-domain-containing protein [Cladochytrium replicatum]|nr:ornithine decarboxylase antizyme-domain-containing protein [Cladochytrium replicatum]